MIRTEKVTIPNQNLTIDAYLARPETPGKFPAIIVIQEIFGVNAHIRDVTDRLANQGFVAIAPAIFQRLAPGFEAGYTPEEVIIGRTYKNQTKASELLSDIQATINYLYSLPQVQQGGVGAMGFCFGGHVVYLTATLAEIKATASFYGAGITNSCPGEKEPTIGRTKDIKGTIYAFFGLEDASIPVAEINEIEAELTKQKIKHEIFRYSGAEHGFFCDRRGSYNQKAATEAWHKVLQLFTDSIK